jgi:hypothetical protein
LAGLSSADEVKQFLMDKLSARMPDPDSSPVLHHAVSTYQVHRYGCDIFGPVSLC